MSENRARTSKTAYAGAAVAVGVGRLVASAIRCGERGWFLRGGAAVMMSALGGGLGPGLFATALGVVGNTALLVMRTGSPGLYHPGDVARVVVLVCVGVSIAAAAEAG